MPRFNRLNHSLALVTSFCTLILLCAGALVTSTGSGLSVPDWPLSYGQVFPPMVGGILFEHGHRLIASAVGFLTVVQALRFWFREPRAWVRNLSLAAVGMVILQGTLGGLTVLYRLPIAVSVSHACLAQLFFCTTLVMALATSRGWYEETFGAPLPSRLPAYCLIVSVGFFFQLLAGAVMRHLGAGLAIPDFPTAFGGFLPPFDSLGVTIHFLHRTGAYLMTAAVIALVSYIFKTSAQRLDLVLFAGALSLVLTFQIMLGAMVIWMQRPVWLTMTHLGVGALCLGTSVMLTAKAFRLSRLVFIANGHSPILSPRWEPA